jgi:hypothetical protein
VVYEEVFGQMMWLGVISGVVLLVVSPWLNRMARR